MTREIYDKGRNILGHRKMTNGWVARVILPLLAALLLSSCCGFIATEVECEVKPQTNNTLLVREWWRDIRCPTNDIHGSHTATDAVVTAYKRGAIDDIIQMVHMVTNRSENCRTHGADDWTVAKQKLANCHGALSAFNEYRVRREVARWCMRDIGAGITGNCFFFNWSTDAYWRLEHNGTVQAAHDEKFQVRWPTNAARLWLKLKLREPAGLPLGELYQEYLDSNRSWGTNPVEHVRWR